MKTRLFQAAIALGISLLAGCHGLPQQQDATATWSDSKLYSEAQDALRARDWTQCIKYFQKIQGRNPFGIYAQQALLNTAYCQWRDNDRSASYNSVNRFVRLYPNHPDIAYAYYLKGLINFNDNLGFLGRFSGQDYSERDPKALSSAYDAFKTVVTQYAHSPYAQDSAARMRYIVNTLANYEVHVAAYYYTHGAYIAAVNRSQHAIKTYKNTPAIENALKILILSYEKLNLPTLADGAKRILKTSFPNSKLEGWRVSDLEKTSWWQI